MNKVNLEEKIQQIFVNSISIEEKEFDWDKERDSFENWDSFSHMQLISELESEFGISFEMEEIIAITKPGDLLPLLKKKIKVS